MLSVNPLVRHDPVDQCAHQRVAPAAISMDHPIEHERQQSSTEPGIDALVAAWLTGLRSPNTRAAYRHDLALFAAWCASTGRSVMGADTDDVQTFHDHCATTGASPATVARRLASIASFYRHATGQDGTPVNPADDVRRSPRLATSSTAQLDATQAAAVWAAAVALGPKTAGLVGLVLHDGIKVGEILRLDMAALRTSRAGTVLDVARRGAATPIVLDRRTASMLRAYHAGRSHGPLMLGDSPTRRASRLTRFGADYLIKRSGEAAGLAEPLTANALRRTHIAHAHARGTSLRDVQAAVGHADVRTTRRYLT